MFLPDAAPPCNEVGEQLRDGGTIRAARTRPVETLTLQLAALEAAVSGQDFTVDDLTPTDQLTSPFQNRGPFRGAAMIGLAKRRLITQTGERRRSERAHRHAGRNPVWRAAAPPDVLQAAIDDIAKTLRALTPAQAEAAAS
jgi:hypothetical protein